MAPLRSAALAATLLVAPLALAQSGGFVPGELILYSPAIQGSGSSDGAIVRIDPSSGQTSILIDLEATSAHEGVIAYDAFRDRLVFCGGLVFNQPTRAYTADGLGQTHDLGLGARVLHAFAPASAGRIYYVDDQSLASAPIKYIDADDVEHVLLDSGGVQPYTAIGTPIIAREMIYDAATNALFVASSGSANQACAGGSSVAVNVRRVPLSTDGTRAIGPDDCAQFVVDASAAVQPVGWGRAPGGQLLLCVDSNSNNAQPRMLLVDPASMSISIFATSGSYAGAAAVSGGTYSSALSKAVLFDSFNDLLRAYAQGTSGGGTQIVPSIAISSSGGSGEKATLIEIPSGDCGTNNVQLYCTAKTTSGGCVPLLSTYGGPSMSATSGFTIRADSIEPQKSGLFFYGLSGRAAAPFQGGFLCVKPPTRRTPLQTSGGVAACSGSYVFDFNAWLAGGNDPLVLAGTLIDGQFWFRDPASPSTTGLSAGVEFTPCP